MLAREDGRALILVDPLFRVTCLPLLQSLIEKPTLPTATPLLPFTTEGSLLYSTLPDGRAICSLTGSEVSPADPQLHRIRMHPNTPALSRPSAWPVLVKDRPVPEQPKVRTAHSQGFLLNLFGRKVDLHALLGGERRAPNPAPASGSPAGSPNSKTSQTSAQVAWD
jgi:hypothetical protein